MEKNEMMHAVRLNAPHDLEYCSIPVPTPGDMEVVCKVESVAICGTDPHIINGDFPNFWPDKFPLIPGQEWAGVVETLGDSAKALGWKVGDRVCGISHVGCGHCAMCMEGRYTLCDNYGHEEFGHRQYGHYSQGAYAQYMRTNVKAIAKIPDEMDFNVASCMDPLSIALHMVLRSRIEPGDDVLVNGSGGQGLMAILCARALGAGKIMVSGSGFRLDVAKDFGAIPINYRNENVPERVKALTNGKGAKRVFECAGTAVGIQQAIDSVAKGGVVSVVSLPGGDIPLPMRRIVLEEIEIIGNRANPNTLEKAIPLATQFEREMKRLITHELPLSQYEKAFDIFNGRKDNSLKVIMKPQL
ncbi:MAG: alcohol dehydrogenase catalytic domain-containing protein [Sphaerochaetaceae bacterium]|nr:alcohol dehydrogenase catalytic domain-containing protein [Sphaerochaetaceae bacterium]